ncbi:hypothetical protein BCR43DRAFT_6557 [Syncephalastrum racemosum]|uniref:Uncharacterized protein n=1 Tax=Syncephalastrum racemosum TaxID=13706 RepID=A0A1X2HRY0_SYNRA|nr:hypothetical protein BCR43DRAFT_6557 [Syncephalastrum racemosum]
MSIYSDEDEYYESEDEEYAPLQMTSWGSRGETATNAGVPELNITKMGWDSLIDPNARVGPGGLGSGGLHRKGANYKPVSEEYILAQRSGKKPPNPPGTGKKSKKKRAEGSATPPPSARGRGGGRGGSSRGGPSRGGFSRGGYSSNTPSPAPRPSTIRQPANNAWGSSKLADTPFWEQPSGTTTPASNWSTPTLSSNASSTSNRAPTPATAPPAPRPGVAGPGTTSSDSKWATASNASKWAPQNLQSNPVPATSQWAPPPQPVQQPPQSYQQPPPPQSSQQQQQYQPQPQPVQQPAVGSSASKWASATSSSADSKWAAKPTASQAPPPPPEANPIMFTMRLEIADGVYAEIVVRRENDINSLVDEFLTRHHLQIDPEKKLVFGKRLQDIIDSVQMNQQQN